MSTYFCDGIKEVTLLNGVARPDLIARTNADIVYHGPAFALLDYDSKGMSAAVAAECWSAPMAFWALC